MEKVLTLRYHFSVALAIYFQRTQTALRFSYSLHETLMSWVTKCYRVGSFAMLFMYVVESFTQSSSERDTRRNQILFLPINNCNVVVAIWSGSKCNSKKQSKGHKFTITILFYFLLNVMDRWLCQKGNMRDIYMQEDPFLTVNHFLSRSLFYESIDS